MKVLIVGATGGSGRAAVAQFSSRGHEVTAMARTPVSADTSSTNLRWLQGDVMNLNDVYRAVRGQDVVVVTLGIREHPVKVLLSDQSSPSLRVRSIGTQHIVSAMKALSVNRLLVQSTYGIGRTDGQLTLKWRLIFALLLRSQIDDHLRQETIVRSSGLNWTLLQPVGLNDAPAVAAFVTTDLKVPSMALPRASLARVMADVAESGNHHRTSLAIAAAA